MPPYHPQGGALGRATWSMGYYGEVFEAAASEAYVPRMVDQEYMLEDDPGSFLEPGWEEEVLEAGTFREPSGSLHQPRRRQQLQSTTNFLGASLR